MFIVVFAFCLTAKQEPTLQDAQEFLLCSFLASVWRSFSISICSAPPPSPHFHCPLFAFGRKFNLQLACSLRL